MSEPPQKDWSFLMACMFLLMMAATGYVIDSRFKALESRIKVIEQLEAKATK